MRLLLPLRIASLPSAPLLVALLCGALLAGCASPPTGGRLPAAPRTTYYPPLTPSQSDDIAIHALGLVGTPYRYGGNTPDSGFDCSGLIGYVYRSRAGLVPPRTVAQLSGFGEPVGIDEIRTGDLVLFGRGRPTHAGIYVGEGRFVHAPSTGGTVRLDQLAGVYWSKQPMEVRRP
ncbi:MAG: hydrolase Nlp/P60 [Variovorax paradoxus]|uniref:Hydrolase Nlp/P60 n=1 Tax=Variovorax paradoxus TaxID=34073 RepID=A0A2W5QJ74_VARPD|nr:MAG: hydrolase Nlp/P60 [Variovorax paradoxus]